MHDVLRRVPTASKAENDSPLHRFWTSTWSEQRRDEVIHQHFSTDGTIYKTMDISAFSGYVPNPTILIRKEYEVTYNHVLEWFAGTRRIFRTVPPDPPATDLCKPEAHRVFHAFGPGSTGLDLLFFILVERLVTRLPTCLQLSTGRYWFFCEDGVYVIPLGWSTNTVRGLTADILYLVGLGQDERIDDILSACKVRILQATYPRYRSYHWSKSMFRGGSLAAKYFMNNLSLEELLLAKLLQPNASELRDDLLTKFYNDYGSNISTAYAMAVDESKMAEYEADLAVKLKGLTLERWRMMILGLDALGVRQSFPDFADGVPDDALAQQILDIRPRAGGWRYESQVCIAGKRVLEMVREALGDERDRADYELCSIHI